MFLQPILSWLTAANWRSCDRWPNSANWSLPRPRMYLISQYASSESVLLLRASQFSSSATLSRKSWVLLSLGHSQRCLARSLRDQQLGQRSSSDCLQRFICSPVAQKLECCLLSHRRNMIGLDASTWCSQSQPTLSNCSHVHPCSEVRKSLATVLPSR